MAPIPASEKAPLGNVLVIGGCGFLGHHLVDLILESYKASVSVLDLYTTRNRRPDSDGVSYYNGDITDLSSILPVFEKTKPDVVIHTASPTAVDGAKALFKKVNVDGTKVVIEACQKSGVKALVYTSSASIISDSVNDLINADERWPVIPASAQSEYYSLTKAEAEAFVLAANRSPTCPKLLTCAIRPSGIFGPGDVQQTPGFLNAYYNGQTGFQLGSNDNLFDFTYVTNIAHAHLLAARALIYTSTLSHPLQDLEKVDGEAFLITNDSPVYFWDFARAIWKAAGNERGTEHVWVIGQSLGMGVATLLKWISWVTRKPARLTPLQVKYSCMTRYLDIGKAKKRLGYAPLVSLQDGIELAVKWAIDEKAGEGEKKSQ
ncbi:Sterol-4-alpha-carboxylate 3-decarboxylating [Hyphodiscus hymeniophilus]|uniref:Sterol-4-alpha-carboxylate 3-dehydrogenase ERG26, decarboxylating n=1 Tax=Hyphodiscus hymeniophilus TaxID=353542 RepID=A0A9P6VHE6_9HELO|nr:Sterol-4-alpha-carboxylate 3-decarboxylating [Hyphodiscus hymeniophilus]